MDVKAQYVTYVNKDLNYLVLFKNGGSKTQISDQVISFSTGTHKTLYLKKDAAFIGDIQNLQSEFVIMG